MVLNQIVLFILVKKGPNNLSPNIVLVILNIVGLFNSFILIKLILLKIHWLKHKNYKFYNNLSKFIILKNQCPLVLQTNLIYLSLSNEAVFLLSMKPSIKLPLQINCFKLVPFLFLIKHYHISCYPDFLFDLYPPKCFIFVHLIQFIFRIDFLSPNQLHTKPFSILSVLLISLFVSSLELFCL